MKIRANNLDIEVEDSAARDPSFKSRPTVLLIMGLGMQLVAWPAPMVQALEDAGYRVVRFDNRDAGLSSHLDDLGKPNLLWAGFKYKLGLEPDAPYTLGDMAQDALCLLDSLGIGQAHVVGVSMGGMIAQRVAIAAPQRILSLTSIMSSSGARNLPLPRPEVLRAMFNRPLVSSPQAEVDHVVRLFQAIGSPAYPTPEAELRARVNAAAQRSFHPAGTLRQMVAVAADVHRADLLYRITCPTLVVHGKADPLVPLACGEDTARRIAGARLLVIEGMGHDLPPEPVRQLLAALLAHLRAT